MALDCRALQNAFSSPNDTYLREHGWSAIAGTILLGFGKDDLIADLVRALVEETKNNDDVQVRSVRKLREGMLKASPLVGFPRSINGLATLRATLMEVAPKLNEVLESDQSLRAGVSPEEKRRRGRAFFDKIYVQHADRVLEAMNRSSGGDLGEFAISAIYGDLVAETSILDAKETSLLEFVACLTLMAAPQAKGHMYGARHLGNNVEDIKGAIRMVSFISEHTKAPWSEDGMGWLAKLDDW